VRFSDLSIFIIKHILSENTGSRENYFIILIFDLVWIAQMMKHLVSYLQSRQALRFDTKNKMKQKHKTT